MALPNCDCTDDVLTTIPDNCIVTWGKVAGMLIQVTDDTNNSFVTGTNPIVDASSWSSLLTATDTTKVIKLPILQEVTFNAPDILLGAENIDGAQVWNGDAAQLVTYQIDRPAQDVYAALKELAYCKSENISVYFYDGNNKMLCRDLGTDPTSYVGIKISPNTFVCTDPSKESAVGSQFTGNLQFSLKPNWYSGSAFIDLNFDPTTDL